MIDIEPHGAGPSSSGQSQTIKEDSWVERVVAFVSSIPWWLRWVWVVFLAVGAMALLPPDEAAHSNNVVEASFLLLREGNAGARFLSDYLSSRNLRNEVQEGRIVDVAYKEEFTYAHLLEVAGCRQTLLFNDGEVAAVDFCGVVFVTTGNNLIEHIMSRSQFEAHREEVLNQPWSFLKGGGLRRTGPQEPQLGGTARE